MPVAKEGEKKLWLFSSWKRSVFRWPATLLGWRVTSGFWCAAFISEQNDDRKETQSLIFSLLIGINVRLACGNNSACAPFELEKKSFIKVGTGSGNRYWGTKDFFLSRLNDPLAPHHLHTRTLELTLVTPLWGKLSEMGRKVGNNSSNHRVRSFWLWHRSLLCSSASWVTCRCQSGVAIQVCLPPGSGCVYEESVRKST